MTSSYSKIKTLTWDAYKSAAKRNPKMSDNPFSKLVITGKHNTHLSCRHVVHFNQLKLYRFGLNAGYLHLKVKTGYKVRLCLKTNTWAGKIYFHTKTASGNRVLKVPSCADENGKTIHYSGVQYWLGSRGGGSYPGCVELTLEGGDSLALDVSEDHPEQATGVYDVVIDNAYAAEEIDDDIWINTLVTLHSVWKLSNADSAIILDGIDSSPTTGAFLRDNLLDIASQYLPANATNHELYYWGGNVPVNDGGPGVDCSGFVLHVLRKSGLVEWADMTSRTIATKLPRTTSPKAGDLVFFTSQGTGKVVHVEFYNGKSSGDDQALGASGGGSSTFGNDSNAKVKTRLIKNDSRPHFFGSIDDLISGTNVSYYPSKVGSSLNKSKGSRGGYVWNIQRFLKRHGLIEHVDGRYGEGTRIGVEKWQEILKEKWASSYHTGRYVTGVWENNLDYDTRRMDFERSIDTQSERKIKHLSDTFGAPANPFLKFEILGPAANYSWEVSDSVLRLGTNTGVRMTLREGWKMKLELQTNNYDYFFDNLTSWEEHPQIAKCVNLSLGGASSLHVELGGGDSIEFDLNGTIPNLHRFMLILGGKVISKSSPETIDGTESLDINIVDIQAPLATWAEYGDVKPPYWKRDLGESWIDQFLKLRDFDYQVKQLNSKGDSLVIGIKFDVAVELKVLGEGQTRITRLHEEHSNNEKYKIDSVILAGVGIEALSTKFSLKGGSSQKGGPKIGLGFQASAHLEGSWETSYIYSSVDDAITALYCIMLGVAAPHDTHAADYISSSSAQAVSARSSDKFSLGLTGEAAGEAGFAISTSSGTSDGWIANLGGSLNINSALRGNLTLDYDTSKVLIGIECEIGGSINLGSSLGYEYGEKKKKNGVKAKSGKLWDLSGKLKIEIEAPLFDMPPSVAANKKPLEFLMNEQSPSGQSGSLVATGSLDFSTAISNTLAGQILDEAVSSIGVKVSSTLSCEGETIEFKLSFSTTLQKIASFVNSVESFDPESPSGEVGLLQIKKGKGGSSYPNSGNLSATGDGNGFAGTYTANNGKISSVSITSPGSGYTSPPTITADGGGVDAEINAGLKSPLQKALEVVDSLLNVELEIYSIVGGSGGTFGAEVKWLGVGIGASGTIERTDKTSMLQPTTLTGSPSIVMGGLVGLLNDILKPTTGD